MSPDVQPHRRDTHDAYRYCPECGFVGRTTYNVCEINGAGSLMVEIDPYVAEEMIRLGNALWSDDGTVLRVGPVAVGRQQGRWFVRRWRNGTEWRTGYGKHLLQAARRAFPMPLRQPNAEEDR